MKFAVVRSSDLVKAGRWDAKFHIANVENRAMVEKLVALPDDQFERLFDLAPTQREALSVVLTRRVVLHANAGKAGIANSPKHVRAVYLALVLQDINKMEQEAVELEQQAAEVRARKTMIESLLPKE
jgi:hypothetical protein